MGHLPPTIVAVVFGLIVTAMVYTLGHISGAHLNPAVTFGFAIARHFPFEETIAYSFSQIAGAIVAIVVLTILLPDASSYGMTELHVPVMTGFIWEVLLTFFLMLVVMAVATDTRAVGTMAGVAVGATVMIAAYVGGWPTGASMNPARSIGPAIVEGKLELLWLYLIGPFTGATVGAFVYRFIGKESSSAGTNERINS
jgi:MIP family channel proteins